MDSLHAIGFYVSAGISLVGGLGVALLRRRGRRGLAMAGVAIGLAGAAVSLSAGFAAAVVLVCYAACALLIASPAHRGLEVAGHPAWRQVGALAAAALLALLVYAAFKGDFVSATYYGGAFDTAAIGRLLFTHDALAVAAVAALTLVAAVGSTAAWRLRDRTR